MNPTQALADPASKKGGPTRETTGACVGKLPREGQGLVDPLNLLPLLFRYAPTVIPDLPLQAL